MSELLGQTGLLVLGRRAAQDMAQAWPSSQSPTGKLMNALPKVVFSSTLNEVEWSNARVSDRPVQEEVAELKRQAGKVIVVFGGASFARSLAGRGLIDECRLTVQPVALGDGLPLLHGLPEPLQLALVSSTAWADGPITHIYASTSVICDMSTSLDGYVTGTNDNRENPFGDGAEILHDWLSDAATDEDREILPDMIDRVGAVVMGRKSFEKNEGDGGWGYGCPLGDTPCFVVTHHAPTSLHPPIYAFVTNGVVSAINQAKQTAGDKVVSLFGATVMQQALPLGLVDEIRVHVIRS